LTLTPLIFTTTDCLKHFKFEEKLYEKYIDKNDLVYIREFINKIDKDKYKTTSNTINSPIINSKVSKGSKHISSEDKVNNIIIVIIL